MMIHRLFQAAKVIQFLTFSKFISLSGKRFTFPKITKKTDNNNYLYKN